MNSKLAKKIALLSLIANISIPLFSANIQEEIDLTIQPEVIIEEEIISNPEENNTTKNIELETESTEIQQEEHQNNETEIKTEEEQTINKENNLSNQDDDIESFKNRTLVLGQAACFLKTHGEDPYFNVIRPDIDEVKIFKCGCLNKKTGNPQHIKYTEDLAYLCPLEQIMNGFGGNYRYKMKYQGERKTCIGKLIENTIAKEQYEGKIIVDEYKQNIPMFWILKNNEELDCLLEYLARELEYKNFVPKNKTLLALKIDSDKDLSEISKHSKIILDTYFRVLSLSDKDVKEFFQYAKTSMLDGNSYMNNPKYVGETAKQTILRQTEKFYKDFKFKDYAILGGCLITFMIVQELLKDEVTEIKETIKNGFGNIAGADTIFGAIKNGISNLYDKAKNKLA